MYIVISWSVHPAWANWQKKLEPLPLAVVVLSGVDDIVRTARSSPWVRHVPARSSLLAKWSWHERLGREGEEGILFVSVLFALGLSVRCGFVREHAL